MTEKQRMWVCETLERIKFRIKRMTFPAKYAKIIPEFLCIKRRDAQC